MYKFPENLYTDVRIETIFSTDILLENKELTQNKTKTDKGVMIRVFDGNRWYCSSTTKVDKVQEEIDELAGMATPNLNIMEHPIVKAMEINKGVELKYVDNDLSKVENRRKVQLLMTYIPATEGFEELQISKLRYIDNHTEKHIITSKGTDVIFDTQNCCIISRYVLSINDLPVRGSETVYKMTFEELEGGQSLVRDSIERDLAYGKAAVPVVPGVYTCILSPVVTGVFAHESFGHKSEADFMVGDETMKREWAIGTKVGAPILNIIDTGCNEGSGYVPYDDEGTKAKENYIIKDGILTGRLHNAYTAAVLEEPLTGNARALNFEYEPMVRMTNTYIGAGTQTKDELFEGVKEGIYVEDYLHGSGMSTFTIAPSRAYMIREGKIAEPVKVSVISGNVMETLNEIDGISDVVYIHSFGSGGCGKMGQFPLRVGFGGPYIRVNNISVQ